LQIKPDKLQTNKYFLSGPFFIGSIARMIFLFLTQPIQNDIISNESTVAALDIEYRFRGK